jgi:hypothetical protein
MGSSREGRSDSKDDNASNPLTEQQRAAGLRKRAAKKNREAEREAEKESISQATSVASKFFGRPSPLMRKVDEEARAWESVMSVGSIGSVGDVGSIASVPSAPGMTAATTSALGTCTDTFASTGSSSRTGFAMSSERSPKPSSAECQVRHR